MRKLCVTMALSVGVFVMPAGALPAARLANCKVGLGVANDIDRAYRCDFKRDDGFSGSYCAAFLRSDFNPPKFLMLFESGTSLRCTCEATGSFTTPKFDAGKDFLCGEDGFDLEHSYADAASGRVVGQKIKNGRYLDGYAPARSWVFECAPDPACP